MSAIPAGTSPRRPARFLAALTLLLAGPGLVVTPRAAANGPLCPLNEFGIVVVFEGDGFGGASGCFEADRPYLTEGSYDPQASEPDNPALVRSLIVKQGFVASLCTQAAWGGTCRDFRGNAVVPTAAGPYYRFLSLKVRPDASSSCASDLGPCVNVVLTAKIAEFTRAHPAAPGTGAIIAVSVDPGLLKVRAPDGSFVAADLLLHRASNLFDPSSLNRETAGFITSWTAAPGSAICGPGECRLALNGAGAKVRELWNARLQHWVDGEQRSDLPLVVVTRV